MKFRSPSFIHKGVKYISADVEKAAASGDESALELMAILAQKQSGVVSVVPADEGEPSESEATEAPEKPKASKGKGKKGGE